MSGELLRRWIAAEYYPDVKTEELSDEQKSTISALEYAGGGLMGASGGSSGDAVAGAQAGKNAVENNLLGGSEYVRLHGYASTASIWRAVQTIRVGCMSKAMNERDAIGLALAQVVLPCYRAELRLWGSWSRCECRHQLSGGWYDRSGKCGYCWMGKRYQHGEMVWSGNC